MKKIFCLVAGILMIAVLAGCAGNTLKQTRIGQNVSTKVKNSYDTVKLEAEPLETEVIPEQILPEQTLSEPNEDGWMTYTNNVLGFNMEVPEEVKHHGTDAESPWMNFRMDNFSVHANIRTRYPNSRILPCLLDKTCTQGIQNHEYMTSYKMRLDLSGEQGLEVYEMYFDAMTMRGQKYISGPWFYFEKELEDGRYATFRFFIDVSQEAAIEGKLSKNPEGLAIIERMILSIKYI